MSSRMMGIVGVLAVGACGGKEAAVDCEEMAVITVQVVDPDTGQLVDGSMVEHSSPAGLVPCEAVGPGVFECLLPAGEPVNVYGSAEGFQSVGRQVTPSCDLAPVEIRLNTDLGGV